MVFRKPTKTSPVNRRQNAGNKTGATSMFPRGLSHLAHDMINVKGPIGVDIGHRVLDNQKKYPSSIDRRNSADKIQVGQGLYSMDGKKTTTRRDQEIDAKGDYRDQERRKKENSALRKHVDEREDAKKSKW